MKRALLLALGTLSALACACSAPPADEPVRAQPQGIYRTTSGDASDIVFTGAKYWMRPAGCEDASCVERGSYEVAGAELRFVVAGTGRVYVLPFEITETRERSSLGTATLVEGQVSTVPGGSQQLLGVQSFELVGRGYRLLDITPAERGKMFDAASKLAACVLENYDCRLAVGGDIPGEMDVRERFSSMLRRKQIDPHGGNRPGLLGRYENGRILVFDESYSNVNEVTMTILHELGHAAGINHPGEGDSDEWDRVIRDNCLTAQRIRECSR